MISIIPKPHNLQILPGDIQLSIPITVTGINGAQEMLDHLPSLFGDQFHPLPTGSDAQLMLEFNQDQSSEFGSEGYQLTISSNHVTISAAALAGIFYGLQTFRQLLPPAPGGDVTLPCISISDRPRFAWRGFMLDEARHFFGIETVKRVLDWLAFIKINRFHWHLTDYQGWRVEIERYPLLTEVGGRREGSQRRSFSKKYSYMDMNPHEGWYSQAEIREIVAYAAERNITNVPC